MSIIPRLPTKLLMIRYVLNINNVQYYLAYEITFYLESCFCSLNKAPFFGGHKNMSLNIYWNRNGNNDIISNWPKLNIN